MMDSFKGGLSSLLSFDDNPGNILKGFLDKFTNQIINTFVDSFINSVWNKFDLGGFFDKMFGNVSKLGAKAGGNNFGNYMFPGVEGSYDTKLVSAGSIMSGAGGYGVPVLLLTQLR